MCSRFRKTNGKCMIYSLLKINFLTFSVVMGYLHFSVLLIIIATVSAASINKNESTDPLAVGFFNLPDDGEWKKISFQDCTYRSVMLNIEALQRRCSNANNNSLRIRNFAVIDNELGSYVKYLLILFLQKKKIF